MDAVTDVGVSYSDEMYQNTITIESVGKVVIIHWKIAGYLDGYVAIDPKLRRQQGVDPKLTVWLKETPTSASPQG
jgi:hypothetical protein